MGKRDEILDTTQEWLFTAMSCRDRKHSHGRKEERETDAHLTVAIRRQNYSIALTKCFQNIVKLQEEETREEDERDAKG